MTATRAPRGSDALAEEAVLARAAESPADVVDFAAAVGERLGGAFRREEGGIHAVVHGALRGGRLRVVGRSPAGGALYAAASASDASPTADDAGEVPPEPPPPATRRASRAALRVASGASDAEDRGRVVADVLRHVAAIEAAPVEMGRAFGASSVARESLRRADRGRARVAIVATGADRLRRFAVHELPGILLVTAVFAATWIFLLEPRKIPSGSMIPTLLPGDRLLVWKPGAHDVPDRWSVMTFKNPGGETLIKRIVGLPGERFQVRDGDAFADDTLLRKPEWLRRSLRMDFRDEDRFGGGAPAGWVEDAMEGAGPDRGLRLAEIPTLVAYPHERLRDLYLDAWASPSERAGLALEMGRGVFEERGRGVTAFALDRDPAGRTTLRARSADGWLELASVPTPAAAGPVDLSLSYVDGVVRAGALDWRHEQAVTAVPGPATPWALGSIDRLTVDRDLHYTRQGEYGVHGDAFSIEAGHVMALGDNSDDSKDSRFRALGPVPLSRLSGRAVVRIWPPWRLGLVR